MKKRAIITIIQLGIIFGGTHSFAWIEKSSMGKEYTFKYTLKNETHIINKKGDSYEEALEAASSECFNQFKKNKKINYDQGLEIINVCANPKI